MIRLYGCIGRTAFFSLTLICGSVAGYGLTTPKQAAPVAVQATAPPAEDAPETETVHLLTGRSIVINLQVRLRRIYISNPAVLESVASSPTQVVISAKSPGTSNVLLWDEQGHSRLLEVYSDIDVDGLRNALLQQYPNQSIQVRAEEGKVVLSGTAYDKDASDNIAKLASAYSKEVVNALDIAPAPRIKQVMLKVRFASVDRSKLQSFGVNILSTGAANTPGVISTQQFGAPSLASGVVGGTIGATNAGTTTSYSVSNLLNIFLFRSDLNLGLAIQDLATHNVLQLLAEPNLLALSGSQAHFLAGGEFPYPVVQGGIAGGAAAVTIQFRPYGVKLDFTAWIMPDNSIRIHLAPEVSSLDYSNAVTISGFTIPALATRHAETEVLLKDGQSFGIAGLLDQTATNNYNNTPGLASIPILGQLFHSRSLNSANSELMIMITPTIVDPLESNIPAPKDPKLSEKLLDSNTFDQEIHKKN